MAVFVILLRVTNYQQVDADDKSAIVLNLKNDSINLYLGSISS